MTNLKKILNILNKLIIIDSLRVDKKIDYLELQNYLKKNNFKTEIFEKHGIYNLYCEYKYNKNKNIDIAFIGHLDVVPAENEGLWKHDPFKLTQENNNLYGRGTIDMKSSIASFIRAAVDFDKLNIAIIITGDEETDSYGAKATIEYLKKNNIIINHILIGEPTSEQKIGDIIKNGRRGSANFDLIIKGIQGHLAYPEKSKNPIKSLGNIINNLCALKIDNGNEFFQPSHLEISSIETNNQARNIIPHEVKIKFNIRYNTLHTIDSLMELLNNILKNEEYELSVYSNSNPFLSQPTKLSESLSEAIYKVTNIKTQYSTGGGTSDGRFLHEIAPIIEFGPKNDYAHKIDEHIEIDDLESLYKIYYKTLQIFNEKIA